MAHWGLIDYIGVVGGAALLLGFYRTSIGKWKSTSLVYELDNLVAAVLLSIYTFSKLAYVSLVINIVWGIVAFRGVTSYAERRSKARRSSRS